MNNNIFNIIDTAVRRHAKYKSIRDSEKRQRSKHFAAVSITCSFFAVVFSMLVIFVANFVGGKDISSLLSLILFFIPFGIIGGIVVPCVLLINSLICNIYQLKLNRKVIGFISLLLFLAAIGVCAYFILTGLSKF